MLVVTQAYYWLVKIMYDFDSRSDELINKFILGNVTVVILRCSD